MTVAKPKKVEPEKMGILGKLKLLKNTLEKHKVLQEKRKKLKEEEVIKP